MKAMILFVFLFFPFMLFSQSSLYMSGMSSTTDNANTVQSEKKEPDLKSKNKKKTVSKKQTSKKTSVKNKKSTKTTSNKKDIKNKGKASKTAAKTPAKNNSKKYKYVFKKNSKEIYKFDENGNPVKQIKPTAKAKPKKKQQGEKTSTEVKKSSVDLMIGIENNSIFIKNRGQK